MESKLVIYSVLEALVVSLIAVIVGVSLNIAIVLFYLAYIASIITNFMYRKDR